MGLGAAILLAVSLAVVTGSGTARSEGILPAVAHHLDAAIDVGGADEDRVGRRELERPPAGPCPPANPILATSCYVRGTTFDTEPAIVTFQDTPDDSGHGVLATVGQVGATYGYAFDPGRELLYAAAYHKRTSKFGPLGPGGVYAVDLGGNVRPLVTVPNAGPDEHDSSNNYQPDEAGRDDAGKTSLGDIDLAEDGSELLVMNLRDRNIYRVAVPDGQMLGNFAHGAVGEGWAGDARPFGLGVKDGRLYHGVVNSSLSDPEATDLRAYVYASRIDGSDMQRVAEISLDYDRGPHERWNPWPEDDNLGRSEQRHPHAMLTDIEFDDAGNMIVGLRDRYIDTGPSLTEYYRVASGDTLLLRKTGDMQWSFDPGAPEHYSGDALPPYHTEITIGGLARELTRDVVVSTAIDPFRTIERGDESFGAVSAGAIWFDNGSGRDIGREELIYNELRHAGPQGKSMALGDIEVLCGASAQPTPTPTLPDVPTETPVPPTQTPHPTETPQPTVPSATQTPPATLPPGVTPSATPEKPKEKEGPTPVPTSTTELPKLPKTGGGGRTAAPGNWAVLLLTVAAAALGRWWWRWRHGAREV